MNASVKRKFISKRDIIIVIIILIAAGFGIFAASAGGETLDSAGDLLSAPDYGISGENNGSAVERLSAMIFYQGFGIQLAYLDEDAVFSHMFNPEVQFEVKDGTIAFIQSDCRDQLCVYMGQQRRIGDFAACLPNQTFFFVELDQEPEAE